MSVNILPPLGILVLVGGFVVVNVNKTTTDHFQVREVTRVSSSYHHPIMDEVDDADFDHDFDENSPWVEVKGDISEEDFTFHNPESGASTGAKHVGEHVYQPEEKIFEGGADSTEVIELRFKNGRKLSVSSTDTVKMK